MGIAMILYKRKYSYNLTALAMTLLFMAIQLFFFPAALVLAEEVPPPVTTVAESTNQDALPVQEVIAPVLDDVTPPEPVIGPSEPQGPSAPAYTYNKQSGLWESEHYTWDPNTKQTAPKVSQDYSYNPETGMWDTTEWSYIPESQNYQPNVISLAAQPLSVASDPGGQLSISGTGPNSNNTIDVNPQTVGTFDLFYNSAISNKLTSSASTGNALVQGNTEAGDALTGDATVIANVLNLLQSSWLSQSPNIATFLANIDGSVYGDLNVDPDALLYSFGLLPSVDLDINASTNAVIDNDIDLIAQTGDAEVSGNTGAGSATSGDAYALVNLINMINSTISADRSFIGMINIMGDLNGDILIPSNALNATIASTGPNSNNQIAGVGNTDIDANLNSTSTIDNNINSNASTGSALVDSNTSAGNATTGDADTEVNTLNLVGQHVDAERALLVFINVMGQWVGFLFGSPDSLATISETGPNSNNQINADGSSSLNVNATENNLINNDINVTASSGDAEVSNNTSAGNAKTGDATTSVNILNMINSELNLSDWFGVLFINILGNWFGSFGADTTAGNQPAQSSGLLTTANSRTYLATTSTQNSDQSNYLGYIPTSAGTSSGNSNEQILGGVAAKDAGTNIPAQSSSATTLAEANYIGPMLTALLAIGAFLGWRIVVAIRTTDLPA